MKSKKAITSSKLYVLATLLITFLIYSISLFRGWQLFDERLLYAETLLPVPASFNEIWEMYKEFGRNAHVESGNSFFSNYFMVRDVKLPLFILLFAYLCKTSPFTYHFIQLILHLANTLIVWFIFNTVSKAILRESNAFRFIGVSCFTLLWSLHSINVEAILLATNRNSILAYLACFIFILINITQVNKSTWKFNRLHSILLIGFYVLSTFFTEHVYVFPLIIFFITFSIILRKLASFKESLHNALHLTLPYIIGFAVFILTQVVQSSIENINNTGFLERNLWLTPQIFVHNLALMLFPKTLSLYQSNLVHLSPSLISPYSIFCTTFYILFLCLPIISFFICRNLCFIFILFYAIFFSLFPYLHIIFPTYCLSADRYLYFSSFLLVFFVFITTMYFAGKLNCKTPKIVTICLIIITTTLGLRTFIRILDWNSSLKLAQSSVNLSNEPIYKAHKLKIIALNHINNGDIEESKTVLQDALDEIKNAITKYSTNQRQSTKTLQLYGLDTNSLLLKAKYLKADILKNYYQEHTSNILPEYQEAIEKQLNTASPNELGLYADLLMDNKEISQAKQVLEIAYKRFSTSSKILYGLFDLHFSHPQDLSQAAKYLDIAYKLFPNRVDTLNRLLLYAKAANNPQSIAKIAYLLGLRTHNTKSLELSSEIYLRLKDLEGARKAISTLYTLKKNNPSTMLLKSRYLVLQKDFNGAINVLERAYTALKPEAEIRKNILISLINVSLVLQDSKKARYYLSKWTEVDNLSIDDKNTIKQLSQLIAQHTNGGRQEN